MTIPVESTPRASAMVHGCLVQLLFMSSLGGAGGEVAVPSSQEWTVLWRPSMVYIAAQGEPVVNPHQRTASSI
jgi:hypothetical protein